VARGNTMSFIHLFPLVFVLCVSSVSHAQELDVENKVVSTYSIPAIKLHGTIKVGYGMSQAIISLNNGSHYIAHQSEEIADNIVLTDIYSDYVLLNTPLGIKMLEMSASEITINEANYDPNLEIGQSRTFYEPVEENTNANQNISDR